MTMEAHLLALGLALVDLVARTARIRWLVRVAHAPLRWQDAVCLNAWSDLAAALTPMRLGGEPARLAALRVFQVPLRPALRGLALELAIATPTTLLIGAGLAGWHSRARLAAAAEAAGSLWWLVAGGAACLAAAGYWWSGGGPPGRPARWRPRREVPVVLLVVLSTVVSVVSRVAILPALGSHAVAPGSLSAVFLGSFVLLFGQALVPLPAGAGAVDAAFLAGAAGASGLTTLVAWRVYTLGVGVLIGVLLLVWRRWSIRALFGSGRLNFPRPGRRRSVVAQEVIEDRFPAPGHRGGPGSLAESSAEAAVGE